MRQAQPHRRALRWLEGEERSSALPAAREAVGVSCKLASEGECFIACQLVFPLFFFWRQNAGILGQGSGSRVPALSCSVELSEPRVVLMCALFLLKPLLVSRCSALFQGDLALLGLVPLDCVV